MNFAYRDMLQTLSFSKDLHVVPQRLHFCSNEVYEEDMPSPAVTTIYFSSDMNATGLSLCHSRVGGKFKCIANV